MTDKKITVLVVDDNPLVHEFVAEALEAPEFHIISAKDGVEGLRLLDDSSSTIDILLVDVVMPRLNGRDLARVVSAHHPKIKIIFMSGYPNDVLEQYGIPASNIRYLKKPIMMDDLLQAVREELGK